MIGDFWRLVAVVYDLVERNPQALRPSLQCFDGRDGVSVFYAGNVAPRQPRAALDIPLGKVPLLPYRPQSFCNIHASPPRFPDNSTGYLLKNRLDNQFPLRYVLGVLAL